MSDLGTCGMAGCGAPATSVIGVTSYDGASVSDTPTCAEHRRLFFKRELARKMLPLLEAMRDGDRPEEALRLSREVVQYASDEPDPEIKALGAEAAMILDDRDDNSLRRLLDEWREG